VLRFGELTVEAWPTRAPTRVTAHHDGWDFRWLNVLLATGLGALLVLVHFELTALEDEGFDEDGLATAAVTLRQVLMTTPRPVAPRAPAPAERRLERERVTPGAPARGPATSARGPGGRTSARDGLRDLFRGVAGGGVFGEGGLSAQLTGAVGRVVGAAPGLGGLTLRGGGAGGDVGGPERIGALDWTPEGARGPSDVKLVKTRAITPTVLEQPPDVADGCLDKERLRAVVREHLAQVRNCYEALLSRLPALEGRVVVTWHVTTAGVVDSAEVLSTPSPELGACLAGRILTWRFPAAQQAGAGFRVSYPFVFKRSGP
jgi:TonB family protein